MASIDKLTRRLSDFARKQTLIRITCAPKHAAGVINGFVVGVGSKWVLLAQTSDGGYPNGYVAVRLKDITKIQRDHSFAGAFAKTLPDWPPGPPGHVDLDTTRAAISSLSKLAPLIGVEQEHRRNAIWIGVVHDMHSGRVWLHEIRHDATWYDEPLGYKYKRLTLITIGDRYQTALATVAGERPRLPADAPDE